MKRFALPLLLLLFLLGACGPVGDPGNTVLSTQTPLFLVTVGEDATPTVTPFQPFDDSGVPVLVDTTPLAQPYGTPTPFAPPVFDLNAVLPTAGTPVSFYAPPYAPNPVAVLTDDQTVTFLLLGSDQRSESQTYFRTDILIIAALRPATMQVSLISLPRDLYVYIPTVGMDRVNAAYEYGVMYNYPGGGAGLLKDTILYNLGVRIDHLAIVDFNGFRKIVDTLGGVDVPVYCPYTDWHLISPELDENNEDNWEMYTVNPGLVHMDGALALWYARSRSKSSDFDRGRRSQEVLRALYTRAVSTDAISKIPELYEDLSSSVITDLRLGDLLSLAPLALQMNNADISGYYVGRGYVSAWMTPGGASVQLPNGPAIQSMLQQALAPHEKAPENEAILVEVRNGTTNPGWDALAAERLNYAGFTTRLAPADKQDYTQTLLYDLTSNPDLSRGGILLSLLGLDPADFVTSPRQSDVPYVLLLGSDYQPCFNPAGVTP
jgi:polyisoprenyl-teichoic acid--peptidoglycan teichoic acid transferase